jgi:hypothetical protein
VGHVDQEAAHQQRQPAAAAAGIELFAQFAGTLIAIEAPMNASHTSDCIRAVSGRSGPAPNRFLFGCTNTGQLC